jgi:hypothetical protein
MQMLRRVVRSVVTGLLLGVWAMSSVGAAVADAALSAPAGVAPHVAAPDHAADHAAAHAHDCAFCLALQWTAVAAPRIVPPAPPGLVVSGVAATPVLQDRAGVARAAARAPPRAIA